MFSYIKGTLEHKQNDMIIVDCNNIGYSINTALSTVEALGSIGSEVKILTHLYVREDLLCLYGFLTKEELRMFHLLISVSGVGPKAALSLMSTVSSSKFGLSVICDDVKTLTKAAGVGKKIAQRIILELKDKIKKEQLLGIDQSAENVCSVANNSNYEEAINALLVLGYSHIEATTSISNVYTDDIETEEIIKLALKNMVSKA